ncbi:hypothetical protein GGR55DRAFT_150854 [Xylaria sp. FL0064]|nr:hypothetical protein GGR55DRAFT_150854 [Xylaria sp. FL0064]
MATTSGVTTPVPEASPVTQGSKEFIPHAVPVLTRAFRNDPIFNYFMVALSEEERKGYLSEFLTTLLRATILNDGFILEVSSWGCCAGMLPPGKKLDNPRTLFRAGLPAAVMRLKPIGIKVRGYPHCPLYFPASRSLTNTLKRILIDHAMAVKRAKKKAFTPKEMSEYWYLFIIGTDTNRQRQGLGGILLEHMKGHALSHGRRPLWLEASNQNARKLYAKHGFEEVEEITLGVGLVGPDGLARKGGEGVKTWGMVWRPDPKR